MSEEAEIYYMECKVCEKDTNIPDGWEGIEIKDPHCPHCGTKYSVGSELTWDCDVYFYLEIVNGNPS